MVEDRAEAGREQAGARERERENALGQFEEWALLAVKGRPATRCWFLAKIIERITERSNQSGALYATLMRLQREGLAESLILNPGAKRAKRIWGITHRGEQALQEASRIRKALLKSESLLGSDSIEVFGLEGEAGDGDGDSESDLDAMEDDPEAAAAAEAIERALVAAAADGADGEDEDDPIEWS
jgi:DNA-binding PadR family transcriptional regulator